MKFTCVILEVIKKSDRCSHIRVSTHDKTYRFLSFNKAFCDILKTKVGQTCDLDIYPLKEDAYNGETRPSNISANDFFDRDRKYGKRSSGSTSTDNEEGIPF